MSLSFKKTTLLFLIFCGFLFFLINVIELNSNYKNIKPPNATKSPQNTLITKDISNKPQIETDDSTENSFKNVKNPKSKETIIIVKKDQTFSSILDNFNFDNKKKFAIIRAINAIYDCLLYTS